MIEKGTVCTVIYNSERRPCTVMGMADDQSQCSVFVHAWDPIKKEWDPNKPDGITVFKRNELGVLCNNECALLEGLVKIKPREDKRKNGKEENSNTQVPTC